MSWRTPKTALPPSRLGGAASALLAAALLAGPALAQSGAIKSGVRGRVVIDKGLAAATTRPIDTKDTPAYQTAANVRRPSGHGPMPRPTEPAPRIEVILEGADGQDKAVRVLTLEGLRFSPASVLVPKPARLKVTNKQQFNVTVLVGTDETEIEANKSAFVELDAGLHEMRIKELPAARARVRVLEKAMVLPVEGNGLIARVPVEGGQYKLGFYEGAEPLTLQELAIPDTKTVAIDASISANRVVTISVKDGGLTAIKTPPPAPKPKPAPPKPPPPAPEEEEVQ